MNDMRERLLNEFGRYWSEKERTGAVSGLDGIEWMAIRLFASWLLANYQCVPLPEKKSVPLTEED